MNRHRLEANLEQLCADLVSYAEKKRIAVPNPVPGEAARLSKVLYLAHSTSTANFLAICTNGRVLSKAQLAASGQLTLRANSAEVTLGTADAVFFYLAPFRYPATSAGLLFAHTLEEDRRHDGVATPFDSGGLVHIFTRHDPAESPRQFLSRHQLPIPDHRDYLGRSLSVLFHSPADYLDGKEPRWPGPIGLTGGDQRRWTHEVRIPSQVWVRTGHLQAVFAPTALVADSEVERLLSWCESQGVDLITFDTPGNSGFETLQRECLDYIRRKLQ
ncbi:MAG: hypothetical protein HY235_04825 [Acidobacteria bacterium]|nr:hypothetical protein [Acidobacteriota bacterium]